MNCEFVREGSYWTCSKCRSFVPASAIDISWRPSAVCTGPCPIPESAAQTKQEFGLGDMVEAGLSAVGITKDRVQAVASKLGIKDCGCAKRQASLNKLGKKFGIGVDSK